MKKPTLTLLTTPFLDKKKYPEIEFLPARYISLFCCSLGKRKRRDQPNKVATDKRMQKQRKYFSWFIVVASRENRNKIKTFQFSFGLTKHFLVIKDTFQHLHGYVISSKGICRIIIHYDQKWQSKNLFLWLRLCLFIAYLVAGLKSSLTVWWN